MQEPEFRAVDPRKRFLLWFVPPLTVFVAGLVVLLGLRLWWAAQKRQLFARGGKTSPAT